MAFEMEQIKTDPVCDEDDMVSEEDLPYSKDDILQLETEQLQNNFTNGVMVIQPTENIKSESLLEEVYVNDNSNFTFCNGNNDQRNSIDVKRPVVCSLCDDDIHGARNYYCHCDDMHNEKSPSKSKKLMKLEEPSGPEHIEKPFKKMKQEVIGDKSEDEYEKTMENLMENIQDIRTENEQQLKTNYNTEKYQMLVNKLVFESYFSGRINRAKLIGPYFWKSSLLKEDLVQYTRPRQFQGKLKLVKCKTCVKVFARPIQCSKSYVSNPPIDMKLMVNKICNNNNGNEAVDNDKTWKITCQECSLVYYTLYEYNTHVHRHSNYSDHCNACLFNTIHEM